MPKPKILVVDDERAIREALKDIFLMEKFDVDEAEDGKEAYNLIHSRSYDCILCDIKMNGDLDGMGLLEKLQKEDGNIPIIMISGHGNTDTAVEAVKKGAFDYISKPPDLNRLLITVRNAIDHGSLVVETSKLKKKVNGLKEIIGNSPSIQKVKDTIDKVAKTDARVLILGENGTGKELVARWIHEKSTRNHSKLVEVNCAAISPELIDSELFGHEKGSFTSAIKQHIGKFEQANGGTLFLDEIGDMSTDAQAKVLRVLQEGKLSRVGGEKEINVDVRIITATNKNLLAEVEKDNFRMDLYHRLGVIIIEVPTLNERLEDIPLLADHFLADIAAENKTKKLNISEDAIAELQKHNWTGNIRELRNVMERLSIFCTDQTIDAELVKNCVR